MVAPILQVLDLVEGGPPLFARRLHTTREPSDRKGESNGEARRMDVAGIIKWYWRNSPDAKGI